MKAAIKHSNLHNETWLNLKAETEADHLTLQALRDQAKNYGVRFSFVRDSLSISLPEVGQ